MDYGKLAYLKAVDLEVRKFKNCELNIRFLTIDNIEPGEREIIDLTKGSDSAVFVDSSATVAFCLNGEQVYEGKNGFFKVSGGGRITVKCDYEIEKLNFMAIGV